MALRFLEASLDLNALVIQGGHPQRVVACGLGGDRGLAAGRLWHGWQWLWLAGQEACLDDWPRLFDLLLRMKSGEEICYRAVCGATARSAKRTRWIGTSGISPGSWGGAFCLEQLAFGEVATATL